tara:strand:- start:9305 stop:9799 length:495 start_codon:yes stop_codon:yes gene_type:complete
MNDDKIVNSKSKKPNGFNILLGDTTDVLPEIKELSDGFKMVLGGRNRRDKWGLYRTDRGFYWDVDEDVENLSHQFIIIRNPTIYIFFSYVQKSTLNYIKKYYEMIEADFKNYKKKFVFVGLKYKDHKMQRQIKKEIIKWCLELETKYGEGYCNYSEIEDLEVEW